MIVLTPELVVVMKDRQATRRLRPSESARARKTTRGRKQLLAYISAKRAALGK